MNPLALAATGIQKTRETTVRYEVRRDRETGEKGAERPPVVEEFYGLDRARIAALAYALDGPTVTGDRFTGRITIHQVMYLGDKRSTEALVDIIDERVAYRLLNETRLPHAGQLAVSLDRLQAEVDALLPR